MSTANCRNCGWAIYQPVSRSSWVHQNGNISCENDITHAAPDEEYQEAKETYTIIVGVMGREAVETFKSQSLNVVTNVNKAVVAKEAFCLSLNSDDFMIFAPGMVTNVYFKKENVN